MILFFIIMYVIFAGIFNPFRWFYYRPYRRPMYMNPFMFHGMHRHHHHRPMGPPMYGPRRGFWF